MVMIDIVPSLLILTKEVLTKASEVSGLQVAMTAWISHFCLVHLPDWKAGRWANHFSMN